MDLYEKSYRKSKDFLKNSDDEFLQNLISKLNNFDADTLHDRLADIYVQACLETKEEISKFVDDWLMVNTGLDIEKVIELKQEILNLYK